MLFSPLREFLNMPLFWTAVGILSVWRITSVLHTERIARPIRRLFGANETDDVTIYPDTFWGYLISCFWCLSVWVSLIVILGIVFFPYVLLPFALSAGAIIIDNAMGRD